MDGKETPETEKRQRAVAAETAPEREVAEKSEGRRALGEGKGATAALRDGAKRKGNTKEARDRKEKAGPRQTMEGQVGGEERKERGRSVTEEGRCVERVEANGRRDQTAGDTARRERGNGGGLKNGRRAERERERREVTRKREMETDPAATQGRTF